MIHLCARVSEALFEGKSPTSVISPLNTSICISEAQGRFLTPSQCSHRLAKVTVVFWYHRIPSSYSDLSVSACLFWTVVIFGESQRAKQEPHVWSLCLSVSSGALAHLGDFVSFKSLLYCRARWLGLQNIFIQDSGARFLSVRWVLPPCTRPATGAFGLIQI